MRALDRLSVVADPRLDPPNASRLGHGGLGTQLLERQLDAAHHRALRLAQPLARVVVRLVGLVLTLRVADLTLQ
eukprot:2502456-Prymnesium_polylepis.1